MPSEANRFRQGTALWRRWALSSDLLLAGCTRSSVRVSVGEVPLVLVGLAAGWAVGAELHGSVGPEAGGEFGQRADGPAAAALADATGGAGPLGGDMRPPPGATRARSPRHS